MMAEYLFDKKTGSIATDTTGAHHGAIVGAKWISLT